jgi:hypothetical protein
VPGIQVRKLANPVLERCVVATQPLQDLVGVGVEIIQVTGLRADGGQAPLDAATSAFDLGAVYIKFVGTHVEYGKIDANTLEME